MLTCHLTFCCDACVFVQHFPKAQKYISLLAEGQSEKALEHKGESLATLVYSLDGTWTWTW